MGTVRLFHVVTKAKASKPAFYIVNLQAIGAAWQAHAASYPNCPVDLATFQAKVADLVSLQNDARRRVLGAPGKRDEAVRAMVPMVDQLRSYIDIPWAMVAADSGDSAQRRSTYLADTPCARGSPCASARETSRAW